MNERAIIGCLLGTAVGDALGLPYEGLSPRRARKLLGPPDRYRLLLGRGMISDDTEHACFTADAFAVSLDACEFQKQLARRLRNWVRLMPAGIGLATMRACLKLNVGISPARSGVFSAGNGPCMRSTVLGTAIDDIDTLWTYVEASTRITHTDPQATAGAMVVALAAREATTVGTLDVDNAPIVFNEVIKRCPPDVSRQLVDLLEQARSSVVRREATCDFAASLGLGRGVSGYVNHTVPVVLHSAWSHPQDLRAAVMSVIECGGDADTTAAIVGAIVGAAVGKGGIPSPWIDGICEFPRSISWIENVGRRLAVRVSSGAVQPRASLSSLKVLSRNMFFAAVVLSHGFRRLLPPY